jgi:sugar phosphate isomerase/epimerase
LVEKLNCESKADRTIKIIEIVCGSLIGRLARSKDGFIAMLLKRDEAMRNVLKVLAFVSDDAERAGVHFAAELEPGPLFVLSKWNHLTSFCEQVEQHEKLKKCVGLNLDIAHWSLAAILPKYLLSQDPEAVKVLSRVVHAHISDHDKGHLGDVPLGDVHSDDSYFQGWLNVLVHKVKSVNKESLPFSGFVSLELEA